MSNFKSNYPKFLALFIVLVSWFYFQYQHYVPLSVKVWLVNPGVDIAGKPYLSWDSGYGYTGYERKDLEFSKDSGAAVLLLPPTRILKLKFSGGDNDANFAKLIGKVEVSSTLGSMQFDKFTGPESLEILQIPDTKVFSKFLLVFQIGLSLFISICLVCIINFFKSQGGVRQFFAGKDEKGLLTTFIFLFSVYLIWVLAYWPVAMTNDSWSSYSDVKLLKFTDWHPYFYAFFILGLLNIYDSLGLISLTQAGMTALIFSYGIYFCAKQGVKWKYMLPLVLFAGFSIPIGAFNTIMWKDVPFSISVLLGSVLLFKYSNYKQRNNKKIVLGTGEQIILLATALGVVFFRHNGIIYVPIFPLIFFMFLEVKTFRKTIFLFAVCFILIKFVIPKVLDIGKPAGAPYQQMRLTLAIMTHHAFYSPTRDEDIKVIEDATKHSWATITANYPHKWFWLWDNSEVCKNQWNANGGQTEKYNSRFLVRLIYYNLPIFLAEQTYGFFHSIGLDYTKSDKFNNFYENPMQTFGSNLPAPGRVFWGMGIHRNQPSASLSTAAENLISWSSNFNGIFSPLFFIWGLSYLFILLFLVLLIERPLSPVALYVYFHLLSAGFVYFIGAGESWRYFYNIYLSLILLLPFWYVSAAKSAKKA